MNARNHYEILGIDRHANLLQIQKAYRQKALKYHPDLCKEEDAHIKMARVNEAYEILSDADKRMHYNATLGPQAATLHSAPHATLYGTPKEEDDIKYYLPIAAILNKEKIKSDPINVILLGLKENIDRRRFIHNLYDDFNSDLTSSFGLDFTTYNSNDMPDLTFQIYDIPGQGRFDSIMSSYFHQASCILIFDNLNFHVENCKNKMVADFDNCDLISITYAEDVPNECRFKFVAYLDEQYHPHEEVRDVHTAHAMSKDIFSNIESYSSLLRYDTSKWDFSQRDALALSEPTRPGCCT